LGLVPQFFCPIDPFEKTASKRVLKFTPCVSDPAPIPVVIFGRHVLYWVCYATTMKSRSCL